ncbi:hypothetical protein RFI_07863 [Reticulomyxa filosa]|uniref:Actin n=1 Tax=Reticulomyxa filosa TaxID=46433 RepID=X6NTD8_RETFI|nr:hypothetical protein RFI_07863 [Reticulomyxa filosa]|eukprot:ETO29261.1 hypothetical protein RFI_07863 [Reticulomyxa filosa]
MFERFEVPKAYVAIQALLSLFANGKTTGVVCDSGDGVSHAVPIYDGCCLPQGVLRLNLGGRDLTDYMQRLLQETGNSFTTTVEKDMLRTLKEELCYIALNYNEELTKSQQHSHEILQSFTLPDERVIHVNSERFKCPEVLFKPHWIGLEQKGIHHLVNDSIIKCRDVDIARDLYKNIILSGGTTMLKGFAARLTHEIQSLVPTSVSLQVLAPENRKYNVWVGGSILASLTSFQEQWISKFEYKESGSSIVHRKCN